MPHQLDQVGPQWNTVSYIIGSRFPAAGRHGFPWSQSLPGHLPLYQVSVGGAPYHSAPVCLAHGQSQTLGSLSPARSSTPQGDSTVAQATLDKSSRTVVGHSHAGRLPPPLPMMVPPETSMESRSPSQKPSTGPGSSNGCLDVGLGCSPQRPLPDERNLVSSVGYQTHQRARDESGDPGVSSTEGHAQRDCYTSSN